jgi:hypothetical protein
LSFQWLDFVEVLLGRWHSCVGSTEEYSLQWIAHWTSTKIWPQSQYYLQSTPQNTRICVLRWWYEHTNEFCFDFYCDWRSTYEEYKVYWKLILQLWIRTMLVIRSQSILRKACNLLFTTISRSWNNELSNYFFSIKRNLLLLAQQ